jgi:hypothetical protein
MHCGFDHLRAVVRHFPLLKVAAHSRSNITAESSDLLPVMQAALRAHYGRLERGVYRSCAALSLPRVLRVTIPSHRRLKSGDGIAAELPLMVTFQMVWWLHGYARRKFAKSGII